MYEDAGIKDRRSISFSSVVSSVWLVSLLCCQVSEGLDFADGAGRAVVITGLPYARVTDPRVCLLYPLMFCSEFVFRLISEMVAKNS
jgi:hypothetical protein